MSNELYKKTKQKLLSAGLNLSTATIKAAIVVPAYVPNLSTDEFYTTIASHVIGTPQTLATVTVTDGVLNADDIEFPAITAGSTASAVVLYVDTGVAGTSSLIAYLDDITGFPFVTSGVKVTVQWSNGTYKIFSI